MPTLKTKGTKRRIDGGSEERKAIGIFAVEGLVEGLRAGGNCIRYVEPTWMVLQVVH